MRLTWRDGLSSVLAVLVVGIVLALTQGWGWPLLGDYRAGVIALTVVGLLMIAAGASIRTASMADPFLAAGALLGLAAAAMVVFGVILASQETFVILAAVIIALWITATLRHAVEPAPRPQAAP
jgi:hypothetical protein